MLKQHIKKWWASSIIIFVTLFYSGFAAAHGKVTLESDICVRNMAGSMVHLSTYQPQYDPEAEYCTEIPHEGETLWVLDLVDHALRTMPIDIKVVRNNGDTPGETITSLHSTNHADGVIKGQFNLNKGQYTLSITGLGIPALHYEYPLQIQSKNLTDTFFAVTPYIIAFLLIVLFTDKYLKWRQIQH
ncbi:MAG: hypothetical protein KF908_07680 [Nitrosomonas sp.]|nr:hypothetical protein [Nitrosomonas sp.]MCW5599938.1 hypothetical protein [Nitrosomonas sp.]MCW5607160.1 hypothetical protein [Nitrosomonas sp.]